MHSKVLLVEEAILMLGSANFTHNSLEYCVEHSVITRDIESVQTMSSRFNQLWAEGVRLNEDELRADSKHGAERNAEAFKALKDAEQRDPEGRSETGISPSEALAGKEIKAVPLSVPKRNRRQHKGFADWKSEQSKSSSQPLG
jgi:phosphatidylserine/phosphatidylglycerophosphate/cardiolipin synthase-like enzyme